jgi:hypothetical protein
MRSRLLLFALTINLTLALLGCTSKPAPDSNADNSASTASDDSQAKEAKGAGRGSKAAREPRQRQPLVIPAGTTITVSLGSALGSKLNKPNETFSGTVAKDVIVGNRVAIPGGTAMAGTVTDAKPLGRFAGGAVLQLRIDSVNVNGTDLPVEADLRTFSAKGKGKRTAVMAGGGAALGGIVGALAGGGKGAAIGMAAGGGAGGAGAAFTGNKDIVLPSESAVSFQLTQPLEIR